jgi:hypothetical protein
MSLIFVINTVLSFKSNQSLLAHLGDIAEPELWILGVVTLAPAMVIAYMAGKPTLVAFQFDADSRTLQQTGIG